MERQVRRERERLAELVMLYLLRPLPGNTIKVSVLGERTYGSISGIAIEIADSEFGPLNLICDRSDYRPLALVYRRRVPPVTDLADLVIQPEDYRLVSGISVPFAVRYSIVQGSSPIRELVRYISKQVIVNPVLRDEDFVQKRNDESDDPQ
jgi:hypothetical protein